jgi:hypothetical protein
MTRQELKNRITELRALYRDAVATGDSYLAELRKLDIAVAIDDYAIFCEETADIDPEFHSSNPITNYLHAKKRG